MLAAQGGRRHVRFPGTPLEYERRAGSKHDWTRLVQQVRGRLQRVRVGGRCNNGIMRLHVLAPREVHARRRAVQQLVHCSRARVALSTAGRSAENVTRRATDTTRAGLPHGRNLRINGCPTTPQRTVLDKQTKLSSDAYTVLDKQTKLSSDAYTVLDKQTKLSSHAYAVFCAMQLQQHWTGSLRTHPKPPNEGVLSLELQA